MSEPWGFPTSSGLAPGSLTIEVASNELAARLASVRGALPSGVRAIHRPPPVGACAGPTLSLKYQIRQTTREPDTACREHQRDVQPPVDYGRPPGVSRRHAGSAR